MPTGPISKTAVVILGGVLAVGILAVQACARQQDSQPDNQRYLTELRAGIAGHEQEPAGAVFANVRYLKDVPAEQFLVIMDVGYARGLGVSCAHCHVTSDFASDDQRPKRAAREMQQLLRSINEQLGSMKDTKHEVTAISCGTCHRGRPNPMSR